MKVVLDTNVLLSVFAFERGVCVDVFRRCVVRHEMVSSRYILDELQRHLTGKTTLAVDRVDAIISQVGGLATMVEPVTLPVDACRDPDDLPVLGTAIAAQADVLVTGDRDLLELTAAGGVSVVSPRAILDLWSADAEG